MKHLKLTFLLIAFFSLIACSDNSEDEPITPGTETVKERTVIFYLAGEEFKIGNWIADNLNRICSSMSNQVDPQKINVLAYIDLYTRVENIPSTPRLYEIKYSPQLKCGDTLCVTEYKERNSLSPSNLKNFFEMVKKEYPANSYSLVWGSHGSGWFPNPNMMSGRSLGPDGTNYIEMDEFAQIIPKDMKFDYIIFDACFMAQAEVIMQLRNKADYIMAAPTELPIKGFPYDEIDLICNASTENDYKTICEKFKAMYHATGTTYTISLIKCKAIENLAQSFKAIIEASSDDALALLQLNRVQYFDGSQYCFSYVTCCFDIIDLAEKLLATPGNENIENSEELLEQLKSDLNELIKYEAHSKYINFQNYFELKTCCGLSCYWPDPTIPIANSYYYNYDWCSASGMDYVLNSIIEY